MSYLLDVVDSSRYVRHYAELLGLGSNAAFQGRQESGGRIQPGKKDLQESCQDFLATTDLASAALQLSKQNVALEWTLEKSTWRAFASTR